MKNLSIRPAKTANIKEIVEIDKIAFGKNYWNYNVFTNEFNNQYSKYFIATNIDDNIIKGYIGYWKVFNEGHITTLAVLPFYRRNHIADKLLYSLIVNSIKNNIKWLTLEVRISNLPAIYLYEKFKFKQLGIRKKYYQDNNEDALLLWSQIIDRNYIDYIKNIC